MLGPSLFALVLNGCEAGGDSGDSGAGETASLQPRATLSASFGTVMTVRWTTETPGTSSVEWGIDESYGVSVALDDTATDHAIAVGGLPPGGTVHWRAISEVDGETFVSPDIETVTGSAPTDLPDLQVSSEFDETLVAAPFLSSTIGTSNSVQLYDRSGRVLWWQYADSDMSVTDVRLSKDKTSILWAQQPEDRVSANSYVRRISWDGETIEDTPLPLAHHDFVELPDGGYAFCQLDIREYDGMTVVGDAIAEIPRGGNANTDVSVVWSAWDDLPVRVDPETDTGFYPSGLDWIHCNGLKYDESAGAYYLSSHSLGSILKIDRASGNLIWVFGGADNQFTLTSGTWFEKAHSPELTEQGIRLFDNGPTDTFSRAVEYALDEDNLTAEQVWSYDAGEKYSSFVLGDVEDLPDGNVQLSWGSTGTFEQISPAGESLWTGALGFGNFAGFAHPLAQVGGPLPE